MKKAKLCYVLISILLVAHCLEAKTKPKSSDVDKVSKKAQEQSSKAEKEKKKRLISPYEINDIDVEAFKKEYEVKYKIIETTLQKNGIKRKDSKTITAKRLKNTFNELLEVTNLYSQIGKDNLNLDPKAIELLKEIEGTIVLKKKPQKDKIIELNKSILYQMLPLTLDNLRKREIPKLMQCSTTTVTLADCIEMAKQKYKPLKLAQEEISVSKIKLHEATRNLLPNVMGKAEETKGEAEENTGTPDFTEQSYGVQVSYPLFQGGKLLATRRQAKSQFSIAKAKYEKAMQDMVFDVTESYWNVSRTSANLKDYEETLVKQNEYHEMAQKLYKDGVINEREWLAVETQYNQAQYQVQTSQAELESQLWKWADALGLSEPPQCRPTDDIFYNKVEVDLKKCLQYACTTHPDIVIQNEAVIASKADLTIKKSYKWPSVELNGFYGQSGGAYKTEPLKLAEDYSVTVKLTQVFAGNTLTASGFDQKTSPKLGQSTRTKSRTNSATLGLLDGLRNVSEGREAKFNYDQALYNMEKTSTTVASSVRESYFNYKKGLLQVNNAEIDYNLAQRELGITNVNLGDEKAAISDAAQVYNKCTSAKVALRDAKVFYLIAVATLNRAVGKLDYIK